ncbi:MAG TPA: hypothetical protein VGN11_08885 [Candidatus Baltobacteraceae bacterium]|jgi:hypothetical protein|nr:hypothetical protein [Candidatus Baltobacteraceae bacterium]
MKRCLCIGLLSLCAWFVASGTSRAAELSIAGGGFVTGSPSQTGGAVLLSSAASVPSLPVEVQGTLLVPITSQGGYALTGEVRGLSGGGFGGAYVGAGVGFGTLSASRQTGPVLTVFVGKPIAPYTTIELRAYQSTRDDGTTAGFLGLRFTF